MPRADSRRNRERLLAAARAAFAASGPEVPLDVIACQAGLGSGTLYRHFANREALLRAVYWTEIDSLCASGRALLDARSPAEALENWLRQLLELIGRRGLAAKLMAHMRDTPGQFIADCHAAIRATAEPLLSRAQAVGAIRPDLTLRDLMALTHAIALVSEVDPVPTESADRLLGLLLDGLHGSPPTAPPDARQ